MKRFIVLMVFAVICLVSCKEKQESYYLFQGAEMGTLADGIFTTDRGIKMSIVEAPEGADLVTKRRVMLYFTLETNGQQMLVYDIKVNDIFDIAILNITAVAEEEESAPVGDPMNIISSWFGGGYLNICAFYYVDSTKETEQSFSASYKIKGDIADIDVSRDGKGEGYFVESPIEGRTFISIPMQPVWQAYLEKNGSDIIMDEEGSRIMQVSLNWLWYKTSGDTYLNDTFVQNASGPYSPDSN